jgi:hypothetical protein
MLNLILLKTVFSSKNNSRQGVSDATLPALSGDQMMILMQLFQQALASDPRVSEALVALAPAAESEHEEDPSSLDLAITPIDPDLEELFKELPDDMCQGYRATMAELQNKIKEADLQKKQEAAKQQIDKILQKKLSLLPEAARAEFTKKFLSSPPTTESADDEADFSQTGGKADAHRKEEDVSDFDYEDIDGDGYDDVDSPAVSHLTTMGYFVDFTFRWLPFISRVVPRVRGINGRDRKFVLNTGSEIEHKIKLEDIKRIILQIPSDIDEKIDRNLKNRTLTKAHDSDQLIHDIKFYVLKPLWVVFDIAESIGEDAELAAVLAPLKLAYESVKKTVVSEEKTEEWKKRFSKQIKMACKHAEESLKGLIYTLDPAGAAIGFCGGLLFT